MIARERRIAGQPPSWSRPSQAFRHFDGTLPTASEAARRTSPLAVRDYNRGFRTGFILTMALYGVGSAVLVLAFTALGFRP